MKLTLDEITTVISRFKSSVIKLKQSGDYPEREKDMVIMEKLLDIKFELMQEERKKKED